VRAGTLGRSLKRQLQSSENRQRLSGVELRAADWGFDIVLIEQVIDI
jgi:hypothetical protein